MDRTCRTERLGTGARLAAGFLILSIAAAAAPEPRDKGAYGKTVEMFEFAPGRPAMRTAVYEPSTGGAAKPRPLILALHYGGHVTPGYGAEFADLLVLPALKELGAVILAPDCPGRGWTDPVSEEAVLALVAWAKRTWPIDERRVAVTGFSMGGIGTYRLAARHPEVFRAAVPVAGVPDERDLEAAGRVPLYIIHGEADEIIPLDEVQPALKALQKGGADVRVVVVQGLSHYQTAAYVPALKKAAGWLKRTWKAAGSSKE
jgi:dipeptidyl aminopeptidase/acylaminoacyl peptidase